MKKRNVPKFSIGKGQYRPYAPTPTGLKLSEVDDKIQEMSGGCVRPASEGRGTREDLEAAIANARKKFGYEMTGAIDAALASGTIPIVNSSARGELTLLGWADAQGNVVKV